MANCKEKLFAEFAPTTTEEWMAKITEDLKGADFAKKLVWRTNEGFNVQPFYRMEDIEGLATTTSLPGEFPFVRGTKKDNNTWCIRQNICVCCPKEANEKALYILQRGVDSLGFCIKADDVKKDFIETLLEGIACDAVELNFSTCISKAAELAGILVSYFCKKGYDLKALKGSINCDPMDKIVSKGKDMGDFVPCLKALVEACEALPGYRCIGVNALSLNNAGSYIYQELGYALAWGNEYLNLLVDAGVDADKAAKAIKFNFGISGNYFFEIAKFRAARMLWAQIVKQYEPKCDCDCKMKAHAETSTFNMTVFDAHVNLLRSQTEAMSAAIAGVDSITVCPFDKTYETPDDFSERLARNQQLLLKEESHMDKIVDPAAGSYYIETLTNNIAKQAWELFLAVEADADSWLKPRPARYRKPSTPAARPVVRPSASARRSCSAPTSTPTSTNSPTARSPRPAAARVPANAANPPTHSSRSSVLPASLRPSASAPRRAANAPRPSCSPSATSPCVRPALSSAATSWLAPAIRSSTTWASRP